MREIARIAVQVKGGADAGCGSGALGSAVAGETGRKVFGLSANKIVANKIVGRRWIERHVERGTVFVLSKSQ
jgi:predicted RNA methylase